MNTQECAYIEQERAAVLGDLHKNLAAIIVNEEVFDQDRPEGEKLMPYFQNVQMELANDVPFAQNEFIAVIATCSALLFYHKSSRQLEYIYLVREPVQQLSLDESGALHLLFTSGEELVWLKRMPRTLINENILDEVDTQK